MNKDFFDSFEIEIACPQCGHHNPKTVGWIRGHDNLVCDSCDITFELDQKQFSDGFDRVHGEFVKPRRNREFSTHKHGNFHEPAVTLQLR